MTRWYSSFRPSAIWRGAQSRFEHAPSPQEWPHSPQLLGSLVISMRHSLPAPPHLARPAAQSASTIGNGLQEAGSPLASARSGLAAARSGLAEARSTATSGPATGRSAGASAEDSA